jgi:hypothetical protein
MEDARRRTSETSREAMAAFKELTEESERIHALANLSPREKRAAIDRVSEALGLPQAVERMSDAKETESALRRELLTGAQRAAASGDQALARYQEAVDRSHTASSQYQARRGTILANTLSADEVRRTQRDYSSKVARESGTSGSKHQALSWAAAQTASDQSTRRQANDDLDARQQTLAAKPRPLSTHDSRELARLRGDAPSRAAENARLARAAVKAEAARHKNVMKNGPKIADQLSKRADAKDAEARKATIRAWNTEGQKGVDLLAQAAALRAEAKRLRDEEQAVREEHETGVRPKPREDEPPQQAAGGGDVPPGCPPDFKQKCCAQCGHGETCVCEGSGPGGGAAAGARGEDQITTSGRPSDPAAMGITADVRVEEPAAPVRGSPHQYAWGRSPYAHAYVPYAPCSYPGATGRTCEGCRQGWQHIAILEKACGRDDRRAVECLLEAIHRGGSGFGAVERHFQSLGFEVEFRSRMIAYVGPENLRLLRGALEAACIIRNGPPSIEDRDPRDWGGTGMIPFLRGVLGMIGATQRGLEELAADVVEGLFAFTLGALEAALPAVAYDALVDWMTTQLAPLALAGELADAAKSAAIAFFVQKLGLSEDEAAGLLVVVLAVVAAGYAIVTRIVATLKQARKLRKGAEASAQADGSPTVETVRPGPSGPEGTPKVADQPVTPDGQGSGSVQPGKPSVDTSGATRPPDSPSAPVVRGGEPPHSVAPKDAAKPAATGEQRPSGAALAPDEAAGNRSPRGDATETARPPTPTERAKEHLTDADLDAARRELKGEVVKRKADGTPYDHVREVRETQAKLVKRIRELKQSLGDPNLSGIERAAAESELGQASRLLDHSQGFVPPER